MKCLIITASCCLEENISQTEQNLVKFVVNLIAFGKQRGIVELISRYFANTVAHKLKPTGEKDRKYMLLEESMREEGQIFVFDLKVVPEIGKCFYSIQLHVQEFVKVHQDSKAKVSLVV